MEARGKSLMRQVRRLAVVIVAFALMVPTSSHAAQSRPRVLLNSGPFLVAAVDSSVHRYRIVAWKAGRAAEFEGTRVVVLRLSDWGQWQIEDQKVEADALQFSRATGPYTMRFKTTLPKLGEFDLSLVGESPSPQKWLGSDRLTAIYSPTAMTRYPPQSGNDPMPHLAGGERVGFITAMWGWQASGLVRFLP
jgi:hypothetical protein